MPSLNLRAGALRVTYTQGGLRSIRLGSREILRHIYCAVRDQHWRTIPAKVKREEINAGERDFTILVFVEHETQDIRFAWQGIISGSPDSKIVFAIEGEAGTEFLRNRIGMCVLHPLEQCAGCECLVEHTDGTIGKNRFPRLVSPHQPFLDVRSISYAPIAGLMAQVKLSGDTFETEDQRNWSDASFKTYSTPLSIPFPVRVRPGDHVRQQVELTIRGEASDKQADDSACVDIAVDRSRLLPVSAVGILWDGLAEPGPFSHLRLDVRFEHENWQEQLDSAACGSIPLEIAVFTCDPRGDLPKLNSALHRVNAKPARLLLFQQEGDLSDPDAVAIARGIFEGVPVGGGSSANFAELNRRRDLVSALDFLAWPIDPCVHAIDEETIIENLSGQAPALDTARAFAENRPLCVSPVIVPEIAASASWIASSLKHLLIAAAASITYNRSHSLLREICDFQADGVFVTSSSNPLIADALVLRKEKSETVWLANFRPETREIRIAEDHYSLAPYAVRRIELARQ